MEITFRPFKQNDFSAVQELHLRSFRHLAANHYTEKEMKVQEEMILDAEYSAELLKSNMRLAVVGKEIIGTVGWCIHNSTTARNRKVFVCPDHSGQGLGRKLVSLIEDEIRRSEISEVILRASMNAVSFYERVGFSSVQQDNMTLGNVPVPVMMMRKSLSGTYFGRTENAEVHSTVKYHASWQAPAIKLFENIIAAHGGWIAWDRFNTVTLQLEKFEGVLPFVKGLGKTFQAPIRMMVNPKERRVEFDYGTHKDTFLDGKLTFSPEAKEIGNGRTIFKKSTFEKWTPQHSLYFFGYAWSNYIGYPFILPQFELLEWKAAGSSNWFKIRFPADFHTHCRVQKFYFNSDHLLYRHDYHADYAGFGFYAAHCTEGYREKDGLQIACVRKVKPRIGSVAFPVHGIYAELGL